jgi:peptidoglycan/xylan/chitin deacetylase (PgdA/CDA1 family)
MAATLPIITLHALDERPSVISFGPRAFRDGMATLQASGHRTLALQEAVECLSRGAPFPERSLAITFDDGYESVYSQAFPILQRYGWSATVFLTVGANGPRTGSERLPSVEERSMLSWSEIREMQRGGITFGAHTLTHPDLTRLPSARVETEVRDSRAIIEDALGTAVTSFAYPFGRYDRRCRDIVRRHFTCACSDKLGLLHSRSDSYAMERVDVYYLRPEKSFALMATRWFPLYVRGRAGPRQFRRAVQSYIDKVFHRNG